MSVARVIPKRIRDQQDANMSPGSGNNGYAIVYNHTSEKFELGTFEAAGAAAAAVATHVGESDPHTQYALESALGTAALLNVGTGAGNIVQLDGSAKLPAVDGSQLTNLPGVVAAGSTTQVIFNDAGAYAGDAGLTYAKATDRLTVVGGIIAGDWSPPSNSTTAISIWNAARSARVVTVDTTTGSVGIPDINASGKFSVSGTIYATNNIAAGNSFYFPSKDLLFYATAATSGFAGFAYTFSDGSGTVYRQVKAASGYLRESSASTTGILSQLILSRITSSTAVASYGTGVEARLASSTTQDQAAGRLTWEWDRSNVNSAVHGSRSARMRITGNYTGTEHVFIDAIAGSSAPLIGFLGATPVVRQVVPAGSSSDTIITALQNLGLFSQS